VEAMTCDRERIGFNSFRSQQFQSNAMNLDNPIIVIVAGAIVLSIVVGGLFSYFSPESKAERRRRKSNAPIVNKSHRPTVKLSTRTKRSKD
jgi:hypothetical protein